MTTTGHEQAEAIVSTLRVPLPAELIQRDKPFDPPAALLALRERGPVHRVTMRNGEPAWVITGHAEARAALADPRFTSDRSEDDFVTRHLPDEVRKIIAERMFRDGFFINMDPPQHTRFRRLLTGQFTVRRMRDLTQHIEEIVTERLDAMLAAGTTADLVPTFALPVPSLVICELLGVPYADRATFQHWSEVAIRMDGPIEEAMAAGDRMRSYVRELIHHKRAEPTDDILSGLIHNPAADPPLTDEELINIAALLLLAGHETTANMLALGTFALLQHPDQLTALRADPTLMDDAIDELLRYLTIVHTGLFRGTKEDLDLAGHHIPARSLVVISLPAANRDTTHWPQPEVLDVTRPRGPHLAFGHGVHQCLGQQLARVEMSVGYTHLLRRLPNLRLAVPPDQIPLKADLFVYGVYSLPITWDPQ
jgi:cytochrome P450